VCHVSCRDTRPKRLELSAGIDEAVVKQAAGLAPTQKVCYVLESENVVGESMNKVMQQSYWKDRHPRVIEPHVRVSTAQRTIASAAPIAVSFSQPKMDPDEIRRVSVRVMNMQMLIEKVFDGSLASLALQSEMAPDRLRALMDMQIPFGSEIAEHLEKCLNLPGGWLDNKRGAIDVDYLKALIFSTAPLQAQSPMQESAKIAQQEQVDLAHLSGDFEHSSFGDDPAAPAMAGHGGQRSSAAEHSVANALNTEPSATDSRSQQENVINSSQERRGMETRTEKTEKGRATDLGHAKPKRLNDPVTQALIWLNHELDRYRGSKGGPVRPEIAEIMGRAASTVSTWMTGVRKMPDDMIIPLVLTIYKIRLPVADEFRDRMQAAAPAIMRRMPETPDLEAAQGEIEYSKDLGASIGDVSASTHTQVPLIGAAPEPENIQSAADVADVVPRAVQSLDAAVEQSITPIGREQNSEEFRLTVARAADRVASVLQRLMDR